MPDVWQCKERKKKHIAKPNHLWLTIRKQIHKKAFGGAVFSRPSFNISSFVHWLSIFSCTYHWQSNGKARSSFKMTLQFLFLFSNWHTECIDAIKIRQPPNTIADAHVYRKIKTVDILRDFSMCCRVLTVFVCDFFCFWCACRVRLCWSYFFVWLVVWHFARVTNPP